MKIEANNSGDSKEHRTYSHIRDIFDEAYRIVYPLLKSHGETNGVSSHSMLHQTLHDAFPNLHKQDIPILEAALARVFLEQVRLSGQ